MPITRRYFQNLEQYIKDQAQDNNVPDYIVGIIHPNGIFKWCGGESTHNQTLFPIGSLSKAFAATLMAKLVEQGLINWQDDIADFVDFRLAEDIAMPLINCLAHINPLPEHSLTEVSEFGFNLDELLHKLKFIYPKEKTQFSYQNILFGAVSQIVRKLCGKPFNTVMKESLLQPLGMIATTVDFKEYLANADRAKPHILDKNKVTVINDSDYWTRMGPASHIASNLDDLCLWLQCHLGFMSSSIISKGSLDKLHQVVNQRMSQYAMGWWHADEQGLVMAHTGGVTGFESTIAMIPKLNIGIVVSCNLPGKRFPMKVVNHFIQDALNLEYFDVMDFLSLTHPMSLKAATLKRFVGVYHSDLLGQIDVFQQNNALFLRCGKNHIKARLSPIKINTYHHSINDKLALIAPLQCFQITWLDSMRASGKLYYGNDSIAFSCGESGDAIDLILLAEDMAPDAIFAHKEPSSAMASLMTDDCSKDCADRLGKSMSAR